MIEYNPPIVKESINRIDYLWESMSLSVKADRLGDDGKAELWFYHVNGDGTKLLHTSKVNLMSTTTMNQIEKKMTGISSDIPWQQVLTFIASNSMDYMRRGEEGTIIEPLTKDIRHPGYYLEPVVMKGVPSVIYGDKGVNKTNVCLMILGIISIGYSDSPSGLSSIESAKVGMLDWESNRDITDYNLSRLIEGGSTPYFAMPYLRCSQPLVDDIERIANWKQDNNIEVLLIDSLGQAAGSDRFDSAGKAAALKFFEALRMLNVTPLIIAQNAKNETGEKSIYGSTYYTYYSRNIFELKDTKSTNDEDERIVAIVHKISNYSGIYSPIGLKIVYSPDSITISSNEVTLSQLKDRIEDSDAIMDFLRGAGKLCGIAEISEAIGKSDNRTRVVLSHLKKKEKVVNPSTGMWGIRQKE